MDGQGRLVINEDSGSLAIICTGSNWDPVQIQILTWWFWNEA